MKTHRLVSAVFLIMLAACVARAGERLSDLSELTRTAVSGNEPERAEAVAALRALGQAGLDALFETYAVEVARQTRPGADAKGAEWRRIAAALDAVAEQRDSFASRLYWHTDIEEAKRAARASGKPVLSLRLLGKLSEEYSCANSRFFRTALYSNPAVADYLREHFVLHWKSVRPAPRITIDFGDGRRLERTITGNSIHYVLDAEGRPVDALPGLYGPAAFLRELKPAEEAARTSSNSAGRARARFLANYYARRAHSLGADLRADLLAGGVKMPETVVAATQSAQPTALQAASFAVTKSLVELPTVRALSFDFDPAALGRVADEAAWTKIASARLADARLDPSSTTLLIRHNPYTGADTTAAPAALARVVKNFELRVALDTARNQYVMRPALLRWLTEGVGRLDVDELNRRVYAELFLTPDSDPWLGLLPPDTYTALERDGVILNE
jgi:hypothetical protein